MEPVEIEIRMKQNVAEESEKASKGVNGIGAASDKATRELEAQVQRQLITIDKINKALDQLEKRASVKSTTGVDAAQVDATMARIGNLRQMLTEASAELVTMRVDAEKINAVVATMVQQYRLVEQAIKKTQAAGKGGSPAMDSLKEEQRVIVDALGDTGSEAESTFAKMSGLGLATKDAFDQARKSVKQQSDVVKNLKTDLDSMQKAYDGMDGGKQKDALSKELEATRKQYSGAVVDLDRMKVKQDELQISSRRLTEQMEGLRDKMIKLRLEGKENTKEYRALEDLYKRLASESAAVRFAGQDKSGVQGLVQGVTGLSGALTAGVGVMGLFNGKSEEMEKVQARLQSMIAITIGLQEAYNLVDKQGAFYAMYFTKAKNLLTAANLRLAVSLGVSTAAAAALMAVLTLGVSAAIGGVIYLMSKYNKQASESAQIIRDISQKAAESAVEPIVKFKRLQTEYAKLGDDLKAKEKFILENADAFKELGVQVSSVDEAENMFVRHADTFVDSVIKRAKAAAMMDVAAEIYKKALDKMLKAQSMPDTVEFTSAPQYGGTSVTTDVTNSSKTKAVKEAETGMKDALKKVNGLITSALYETDEANKWLELEYFKTVKNMSVGTKPYWEQMQKNYLATINSMTDKEVGTKKWKDAIKNYKNATAKVALFDIKGNDSKAKTAAEKLLNANDSLTKMSLDYDAKIEAARAAAIKNGRSNRLADAKSDFEKQKTQLEKDLIAIGKLEEVTGKPATEQRDKNKELGTAIEQQYQAKVTSINEVADRALADIMSDAKSNFQGELDRNLTSIENYYDDIILKATEEGATEEQLNTLRNQRFQDRARARRDEAMKNIDFELDIEKRRIEMSDKTYLFQADRQKDLVKAERDATVKRLALLEAQYKSTPTPELGRDIKSAKLSLDEFDQTLKDLDVSKLEEIAALVQSLSKLGSSLSKTGGALGEIGDILTGVTSSADDIMTSFKKSSSTMDKISAGISGLADLYSMVADQIAANKAEQDEWTAAIKESQQAARMARIEQEAYQQSNIFGVENPYAKVMASVKQYMTAMKELNDYSKDMESGKVQTGTKKVISGGNIAKGAGAGAAVGAAVGSIIPVVGTAVVGLVGGLIGAAIGAAVGAATTKVVPVFKSLKETYGKVIMDDMSLNPKILQDYDKLDATTKAMVDNWEEIKTKAKEAQEEMNAALTELAGDLGTKLSDSLVEAFRNGDVYDAIDDFHGKVTETIEDIIAQLIFAAAFGDLFDELGKRFKDSFAIGGDGSIVDDLMWFDSTYKGRLDAYNTGMKQMQEQGKALGYDFFSPTSERTGTSKGVSTASQESISELSGGVLAMRSMLAEMRNMQRDELAIMRMINTVLDAIEENTAYCRLLETMETNMDKMANAIDDIAVRGLKMR